MATRRVKSAKNSRKKAAKAPTKINPPKLLQSQRAMLAERAKNFDPKATKQECIEDLRQLYKEHDRFISRDFYRLNGRYSERTWSRFFGTMEEFRSEAGLQPSRHNRQMEKHIAKHAALDEFRKFYRVQIEPWVGKYEIKITREGMKKMIIASDFHDLDTDLFCLSVFLETCRIEQPDIIVFNGDIYDMYEFSKFDKDPRKMNLRARMEFVRDHILRPTREVCPDAQIDFIIGNHEHRLLRHIAAASPHVFCLMEVKDKSLNWLLGLDEFEINLVSKGSTAAYQSKEIKDEVAKNFKMYFGAIVCNHFGNEDFGMTSVGGHTHRPEMSTQSLLKMGPINHLTTGCMCKLDADYTYTKNNWQQSFAIAYVDPVNERVQLNHVIFNDQFVNVNGRYYFRDRDDADMRDTQNAINSIKSREIAGFVNHDEETAVIAGWDKSVKAGAIR